MATLGAPWGPHSDRWSSLASGKCTNATFVITWVVCQARQDEFVLWPINRTSLSKALPYLFVHALMRYPPHRTSFRTATSCLNMPILERCEGRYPPLMLPRRPNFSPCSVTQSKRSVARHTWR